MKSPSCSLFVAAVLNCVFVTTAFAAPTAPVTPRTAVQAGCDGQDKAAANKDITAFMSFLAPDFSARDADNSPISRIQARKNMVTLFAAATHISGTTVIQTFTLKAGKAYITAKEHDNVVTTDPDNQQTITLVDDEIDTEVWCKVGGTWKEETERVVSEKHSMQPGSQLDAAPGQSA